MTMTKGKKRVLLIGIPAAVVVIAAAVVVAAMLQSRRAGPHLVQAYEEKSNPLFVVVDGIEREEFTVPLAFYGWGLPDGWEQVTNAEEKANPFSETYEDHYFNPETGVSITLFQEPAFNNYQVVAEGEFQMIPFGDIEVVCFRNPEGTEITTAPSGAYWIYENTLFTLSCDTVLEYDQIMELVGRMDYSVQREPVYSPLRFSCVPGTSDYEVIGNPEVPEDAKWSYFSQTPEGFTPISCAVNYQDTTAGSFSTGSVCSYENENGVTLTLTNWTVPNNLMNFQIPNSLENGFSLEELNDPDTVEELTVQGKEGLFYYKGRFAKLIWMVNDYCYLTITCYAPTPEALMTRQELLDLASTVSREAAPPQTQSEASASSN